MSSPGLAVLALVKQDRAKADMIEDVSPNTAARLRRNAERYERVVMDSIEEWWELSSVQRVRPWSQKHLRRKCAEYAASGRARKGPSGRWQMRWDAVVALPLPARERTEVDPERDLDGLVNELALEV